MPINGTNGIDFLYGTDGADTINGRGSADVIHARKGSDLVDGGAGNDWIFAGRGHDTVFGGTGDDTVDGGGGDDRIEGEGGNDVLDGGQGRDSLYGGDGNDLLSGGAGSDVLVGGHGWDVLAGGAGADFINGGSGFDFADYAGSTAGVFVSLLSGQAAYGHAEGDTLVNIEGLFGSAHDDVLIGDHAANWLTGGAGDDALFGNGGRDTIDGGAGNDTVFAGDGWDHVFTGLGFDWIDGGADGWDHLDFSPNGAYGWIIDMIAGVAEQTVSKGAQSVVLNATEFTGFEQITGSDADDIIMGDAGRNTLRGGAGDDILFGNGGGDSLHSGAGAHDRLFGGGGDDWLAADAEAQFVQMTGDSGADYFFFDFDQATPGGLRGEVTDFDRAEGDVITFSYSHADTLVFMGEGAFTGDGQMAYRVQPILGGTQSQVQMDTDGDGATDWFFNVTTADQSPLGASDFFFD